jgi:hypothetical protein
VKHKVVKRLTRLWSNPVLYLEWLVTVLFAALGVASNVTGMLPLFKNREVLFLTFGLLSFGSLNVALVHSVGAYKVRYRRGQRAYAIIHDVAEEARNLRDDPQNANNCRRAINAICFGHIERLLRDFLGFAPKITLKYVHLEKLHALRSGNQQGRDGLPEPVQNNEIFEKLSRHLDKFKAIYIRDVHDQDELRQTFGVDCDRLRQRAEGKYRSFIALPLRWSQYGDGQLPMKGTIGMLGFDGPHPGSFGDLEEEDFQALYAIVDILSECVIYWQRCQGVGNGTP